MSIESAGSSSSSDSEVVKGSLQLELHRDHKVSVTTRRDVWSRAAIDVEPSTGDINAIAAHLVLDNANADGDSIADSDDCKTATGEHRVKISMDNVVLRGMSIQGNASVIGMVIYTGQDCLLFKHLNAGK